MMKQTTNFPLASAIAALGLAAVACGMTGKSLAAPQGKTEALFNGKNLDGWYTFIQDHGKNSDPLGIFKVEDGVIHVSGQKFGYISTEKEYENYRLRVDYKWGDKKWPPRENAVRDAGLLYHVTGTDQVWAKCQELQIQEGDTGDLWLIPGSGESPSVEVLGKQLGGDKKYTRAVKWSDHEKPKGEWNTVMLVVRGDRFEHWVNGKVNLVGKRSNRTRGRINLQSEGAELYYRNIILEPLD